MINPGTVGAEGDESRDLPVNHMVAIFEKVGG